MKKYFFLLVIFVFISCSQNRSYRIENTYSFDYRLNSQQILKNIIEGNEAVYLDFYQISNRRYYNWDFYIRTSVPLTRLYINSIQFEYLDKKLNYNVDKLLDLTNVNTEQFIISEDKNIQTYYYACFYDKKDNVLYKALSKEKDEIFAIKVTIEYTMNETDNKSIQLEYVAKQYYRSKALPEWAEN